MINQDELMKMAREAGFLTGAMTGRDGFMEFPVIQSAGNGNCFVELQAFACAILERAAEGFDQPHMEYFGCNIQETIRALKPTL